MSYEWDPAKARANLSKHGVDFADAAAALEDEQALTIRDARSSDEERWITVGRAPSSVWWSWSTRGAEKMSG